MEKHLQFGTMVVMSGTTESRLRHSCGTLSKKMNFEPWSQQKNQPRIKAAVMIMKQGALRFLIFYYSKKRPSSPELPQTPNSELRFLEICLSMEMFAQSNELRHFFA